MFSLRRSNKATPRTELPKVSSRGEKAPTPTWPGRAPRMPPATPDFAGMPTVESQSPAASYIPQLVITEST
jgi:hypothetical protein